MNTPVDASYLADAVILLRYFEARGEVRQAISVVKKRAASTSGRFAIPPDGARINSASRCVDFRGVLTGVPIAGRSVRARLEGRSEMMGSHRLDRIQSAGGDPDPDRKDAALTLATFLGEEQPSNRWFVPTFSVPVERVN